MYYLLFPIVLLALSLALGCGPAAQTEPQSAADPVTEREDYSPTETPKIESTKEYLASLPILERQDAEWKILQERENERKFDARIQANQWIDFSMPKCHEFFGTKKCKLGIVELVPSEVCKFKFGEPLRSTKDMEGEGHYFLTLNAGGYIWVASYGYEARVGGGVLNITDCWAENPSEIGATPRPMYTPGPTSIFNDWQTPDVHRRDYVPNPRKQLDSCATSFSTHCMDKDKPEYP